jgi:GNAT superfamily N-acetyltransferase
MLVTRHRVVNYEHARLDRLDPEVHERLGELTVQGGMMRRWLRDAAGEQSASNSIPCVLARAGGRIVGWSAYEPGDGLVAVFVEPGERGKGLGGRLVAAVVGDARREDPECTMRCRIAEDFGSPALLSAVRMFAAAGVEIGTRVACSRCGMRGMDVLDPCPRCFPREAE